MNSYERIKAMTEGKPIDRIGVSAWYHMPLLDHVAKDFAYGIVNSVKIMHWDVCKIQYHSMFMDASFGVKYVPSTSASLLMGPITELAVYHPKMFPKLKPTSVKEGTLARDLEVTKRVMDELGGKVPVLATIFSPMYEARDLTGGHAYKGYIQNFIKYDPEDVKKGLEIITDQTIKFIDELLKIGIDGIFYADAFADYDDMDKETYAEFCAPYDLQILNYIKDKTWFNMLHVHGYKNLRFDQYEELKYPVQAYNWEDRFGDATHEPITLKQVRAMTDKILMGGVEFWHDFDSATNDRYEVKARIKERLIDALEQLGPDDQKFIFTPGCSVKMHVPEYRMQLMHEVIEEVTGIA